MSIKKINLKIVVIGGLATGKTSYINKVAKNQFSETYLYTIGFESEFKEINKSNEKIMARLCECPEFKERIHTNKNFLRETVGCIFLSDSTKIQTRKEALEYKKIIDKTIKFSDNTKIPCILVESKRDLINDEKEKEKVEKQLKSFAVSNGFDGSFLVSSKTGENLNESLEFIVNIIRKKQKDVGENEEDGEKKGVILIGSDSDKESESESESDNESKFDLENICFDSSEDDILKISASTYECEVSFSKLKKKHKILNRIDDIDNLVKLFDKLKDNKKIKINLYLEEVLLNISVIVYDFCGEYEEIKFTLKDSAIEDEDLLYKVLAKVPEMKKSKGKKRKIKKK